MTLETGESSGAPIINKESSFVQELQKHGFSMKEVKKPNQRYNAMVYQHEPSLTNEQQKRSNLLLLPGISGEPGGTTHVSVTFLAEIDNVDTAVGVNSSVSTSALEASKYDADLDKQTSDLVALYKESVGEDKEKPLIIVGHSLGGGNGALVAQRLLEEGYNVEQLFLFAPTGLVDRKTGSFLYDGLRMNKLSHYTQDIPILYPSPVDLAEFQKLEEELSNKPHLNLQEQEAREVYRLALERATNPDKLLLVNLGVEKKAAVEKIDAEMTDLIAQEDNSLMKKIRLQLLQKKRIFLLRKAVMDAVFGKINNDLSQAPMDIKQMRRMAGNLMHSPKSLLTTAGEMGKDITVATIDQLISFNNGLVTQEGDPHPLNITIVSGKKDPVPGDYERGEPNAVQVGPKITLAELSVPHMDHFTIASDPKRVAHMINRRAA